MSSTEMHSYRQAARHVLLNMVTAAWLASSCAYAFSATGTITSSVVFVDFEDLEGDAITEAFDRFTVGERAAQWFREESEGRLELAFELYHGHSRGQWIRAPKPLAHYDAQPDAGPFIDDILPLVQPQRNWGIVYFALPKRTKPVHPDPLGPGYHGVRQWRSVSPRVVVMGDYAYRSASPECRALLHETGHALGLPDLYSAAQYRSYG